ncbi:hypothetical protein FOCC_FOCC004044 [Frankliniella occidentalis]|nr:hypothetical protein FOCC_FOCC004044 [Frankliniella occidentalis]
MQNWEYDLKHQSIKWKKVKEIFINGQEGSIVRVKYDFDSDYVTMSSNKKGRPVNLKAYEPPLAYTGSIPLSTNTIKDLTYLCDNLHVALEKQTFLRSVLSGINPVEEEVVSDLEFDSDEEMCNGSGNTEDLSNSRENNNSDEEDQNLDEVE